MYPYDRRSKLCSCWFGPAEGTRPIVALPAGLMEESDPLSSCTNDQESRVRPTLDTGDVGSRPIAISGCIKSGKQVKALARFPPTTPKTALSRKVRSNCPRGDGDCGHPCVERYRDTRPCTILATGPPPPSTSTSHKCSLHKPKLLNEPRMLKWFMILEMTVCAEKLTISYRKWIVSTRGKTTAPIKVFWSRHDKS
ncbi:hypothetical protein J6590_014250 [Homalodisca vitripennis]|nr:hypothetical protein J6590_014250 [Homalodisca vitripennis]